MPTNVDTVIAELNPDHRKKVEVRAAQLIAEENATSGVEQFQALAAVERIRAKARNLKAGALDRDLCKADRDAGRP